MYVYYEDRSDAIQSMTTALIRERDKLSWVRSIQNLKELFSIRILDIVNVNVKISSDQKFVI
jgi:hypothetical protein